MITAPQRALQKWMGARTSWWLLDGTAAKTVARISTFCKFLRIIILKIPENSLTSFKFIPRVFCSSHCHLPRFWELSVPHRLALAEFWVSSLPQRSAPTLVQGTFGISKIHQNILLFSCRAVFKLTLRSLDGTSSGQLALIALGVLCSAALAEFWVRPCLFRNFTFTPRFWQYSGIYQFENFWKLGFGSATMFKLTFRCLQLRAIWAYTFVEGSGLCGATLAEFWVRASVGSSAYALFGFFTAFENISENLENVFGVLEAPRVGHRGSSSAALVLSFWISARCYHAPSKTSRAVPKLPDQLSYPRIVAVLGPRNLEISLESGMAENGPNLGTALGLTLGIFVLRTWSAYPLIALSVLRVTFYHEFWSGCWVSRAVSILAPQKVGNILRILSLLGILSAVSATVIRRTLWVLELWTIWA